MGTSTTLTRIQALVVLIVIKLLTIFYSAIFIIRLIFLIVTSPTKNRFKVQQRNHPPNVLTNSNYGMHKYVRLKEIKLHYVDSGNANNTAIVFLHGFPDFWFSWRHQIKEFSKTFRTIAVDLRGYGDSDKPFGSKHYTLNVVVEDIKDLLDALGIERCILVGHDWGGLIVWQFAQMYPHRLQKFIVINAPERTVFWRYIFTSFDQFKRSWYIFFFQSPYLPEIAFILDDLKVFEDVYRTNEQLAILNAEELEAYKYTFGKTDALTPPLNYYRAIKYEGKSRKLSSNRQSEAVKLSGLLIISDEDRALSRGLLELSAKMFGSDRIAIQLITKAGHFVQQEKPCEVNQAIAAFIL